jgi:hypothetical protein
LQLLDQSLNWLSMLANCAPHHAIPIRHNCRCSHLRKLRRLVPDRWILRTETDQAAMSVDAAFLALSGRRNDDETA